MSDWFADSHGILAGWSKRFYQPLDVLGVNNFRKTEVHTAEPVGPEPIAFGFEMAIERVKRRKSPGIDHITAELFKAWGKSISSEIDELINPVWNKEELSEE
jgi:hypothetical protein